MKYHFMNNPCGYAEGCTKENCDSVDIMVNGVCERC